MIHVVLPLQTKNPTNNRQHWRTVWSRAKRERGTACMLVRLQLQQTPVELATVNIRITRLSSGELDDDNLRAALKSIRDGVADAFGSDDSRKSRLQFHYAQEKCKRGAFAVRVEIS